MINYDLTPREKEVLELLAQGKSNNEIAEELNVAHTTAKFHVANILSKMDVRNRTQAALQAHTILDVQLEGATA